MEGVERAKNAFKSNFFHRCFISDKNRKKLFKDRWLKVQKGIEPELLIWENFGVSTFSRIMRVMLYIIFVFVMLVFCFWSILKLE